MSFEPETEVVELESRLGRVGSIQAWDPWKSRRSVDDAKWWVSKIARLSHGLGEAEDYAAHFDRVVNQLHHESVLEFVPAKIPDGKGGYLWGPLPLESVRGLKRSPGEYTAFWENDEMLSTEYVLDELQGRRFSRASAFLVECPIFVARQWMRHRSFAYLEMSRRYVTGSRVAWEFYGDDSDLEESPLSDFHASSVCEYERRLAVGMSAEIARGCIPGEAMTKFWVAGFDRDWRAFLALRNDPHAQAEIRVFAQWIENYLSTKEKV